MISKRLKDLLLSPGRYQHYKGGRYRVISVAEHTETGERLVVYVDEFSGRYWVRPLVMFTEAVTVDGVEQLRFRKLTD